MTQADAQGLDLIWRNARTCTAWLNQPVENTLLLQIYDLCKWGATSANCQPLRVVFITSPEAKQRLKPCLAAGNVEKTMSAPVTAIFGNDMEFYNNLPTQFPHMDARSGYLGNDALIATAAMRNGSLQTGYFMLAARALGLDCGPMSGFDNAKVDGEFFADSPIRSNFLCNLGYGDKSKLYPRGPRLSFGEACKVL